MPKSHEYDDRALDPDEGYLIPSGTHEVQEVIRRSRFITVLGHAASGDAAKAFVAQARVQWPDATHHCWAFVAGVPGSTQSIGMSDDGEPHGSAGRPMLTALLHSGVGEIVAVVVRYYGGVKLGTGGLARAYAGGVVAGLATLPTSRKIDRVPCVIQVGYEAAAAVDRILGDLEALVHKTEYTDTVTINCEIARRKRTHLRRSVADATAGQGRLQFHEPEDRA